MSTALSVTPVTVAQQQGLFQNTIKIARADFSITQMTSLFSTPLAVVPALAGYMYLPIWWTLSRTTRFDTQPANIKLVWGTSIGGGFIGATVLTDAPTNGFYSRFNIFAVGYDFETTDAVGALGNKPLTLTTTVGNPTVSGPNPGSTCTVLVAYYVLPCSQTLIGSY